MASRIPGPDPSLWEWYLFSENTWEFQPSKNHMHILLPRFAKYISHAWKCSMTAQSVHSMIKTNIKKYWPGNLKYTRFLSKHLQTPKKNKAFDKPCGSSRFSIATCLHDHPHLIIWHHCNLTAAGKIYSWKVFHLNSSEMFMITSGIYGISMIN